MPSFESIKISDLACTALETSIVLSDLDAHRFPSTLCPLSATFPKSGSSAGRNVEKMYAHSIATGKRCHIEDAVWSCFEKKRVKHVLIVSGFFVLHDLGGMSNPDIASGSCETDGPLGAMALARAFASQGVRVSIFCDQHNGPVMRAAYQAQIAYFEKLDSGVAGALRGSRGALDDISDSVASIDDALLAHTYGSDDAHSELRKRALAVALGLKGAVERAWSDAADICTIDCLFAIERLGAPYRNARGKDISEHTEPIDALWPSSKTLAAVRHISPSLASIEETT